MSVAMFKAWLYSSGDISPIGDKEEVGMFCTKCGQEAVAEAGFCFKCGVQLVQSATQSADNRSVADNRFKRALIRTYGLLSIVIGALGIGGTLKDLADSTFKATSMAAVGVQSLLFVASGLALLSRHRRAVPLQWTATVLSAIGVLNRGVTPLDFVIWVLQLAFTIWYGRKGSAVELSNPGRWQLAAGTIFVISVALALSGVAPRKAAPQNVSLASTIDMSPRFVPGGDGKAYVSVASNGSLPPPGEIKTAEQLQRAYVVNRDSFPPHVLACFPDKKLLCENGTCGSMPLGVFVLIGPEFSTLSRCDRSGCDTFPSTSSQSGEFLNVQPRDPKGVLVKLSSKTSDFVEVASMGVGAYVSSGKCERTR